MVMWRLDEEFISKAVQGTLNFIVRCHHLFNHTNGPRLNNIFGKSAGTQKGYKFYSYKNRALGYQWSKQRLYYLFGI